jgi:hypothetical protein
MKGTRIGIQIAKVLNKLLLIIRASTNFVYWVHEQHSDFKLACIPVNQNSEDIENKQAFLHRHFTCFAQVLHKQGIKRKSFKCTDTKEYLTIHAILFCFVGLTEGESFGILEQLWGAFMGAYSYSCLKTCFLRTLFPLQKNIFKIVFFLQAVVIRLAECYGERVLQCLGERDSVGPLRR